MKPVDFGNQRQYPWELDTDSLYLVLHERSSIL